MRDRIQHGHAFSGQRDAAPPAQITFGKINPAPALDEFRRELNQEMIALLRSLPGPLHAEAVVFFLQHLGTPFIPEFDYFRHYHAPAWSTLYWLADQDASGALAPEEYRWALTAHAMALFLHLLDDHLNDGQLAPTHLSLLLRSQAWLRMQTALKALAGSVTGGNAVVRGFLDDYYASIGTPPPVATLDGYCEHFRKQMATWQIVPVLMARRQTRDRRFAEALEKAYSAFGTAWRLLDDLQDIEPDRLSGARSAVYYSLPVHLRPDWSLGGKALKKPSGRGIAALLATQEIQGAIRARIHAELSSAAGTVAGLGLNGLAAELHALALPFENPGGVS